MCLNQNAHAAGCDWPNHYRQKRCEHSDAGVSRNAVRQSSRPASPRCSCLMWPGQQSQSLSHEIFFLNKSIERGFLGCWLNHLTDRLPAHDTVCNLYAEIDTARMRTKLNSTSPSCPSRGRQTMFLKVARLPDLWVSAKPESLQQFELKRFHKKIIYIYNEYLSPK